jgi:hypothetical protein
MAQQGNTWTDDAVFVPGIRRKPIGDEAMAPADAPPDEMPADRTPSDDYEHKFGSGSGPREGVVGGQEPPQMPTMTPEPPRVEYGGSPTPPPQQSQPSTGGPIGAPGPSTATPSMPNEPTPAAAQGPNPSVAGPAAMPPPFTPMQAPLGGQQVAQAAYPIERQDPSGGWAGASDATSSYPITRRPIGPLTGQARTQGSRLLGGAGGLLGGGLGVPGQLGGSTQESTDIGNLIASLYRMANQNTQG